MEGTAVGYAPTVTVRPPEREIYRKLWETDEYRVTAPGEQGAWDFIERVKPRPGSEVLDIGCGTGRGGWVLAVAGLNVTLLDFADNCLDEDVAATCKSQPHALRFKECDITKAIPATGIYGFCTDVMEHIPPAQVDAVLDNILSAVQYGFFQISTVPDVMHKLVGHDLHLTVKPYEWWLGKFNERNCVMLHSRDCGTWCEFYVTAWTDTQKLVDAGTPNTTNEELRKNVEENIKGDWLQIQPHVENDLEVMILGGGPSLNDHKDDIKRLRGEGVKLIALNGAYNWCLENDIKPSAVVVVDAREFNARFTHPVVDDCKYMIASQCHPKVLEGLPKERTYLWHTTDECFKDLLDEKYGAWFGVPGGTTVLLRAIPLFRMLGYKKYHLFGCDSCIPKDEHHAYPQSENDSPLVIPVGVGGRTFHCHGWMAAQGQEFVTMINKLGNELEIEVYGDGLLAHILKTGAELQLEVENGSGNLEDLREGEEVHR